MSQQGAPLDVPAHLREASRERLLAEIGTIQHQYRIAELANVHAQENLVLRTEIARLEGVVNDLDRRINDLTTQLMHSRDYAMGKAAELGEIHLHVAEIQQQLKRARNQLKQARESTTWKLGRLVMTPVRLAKRVLRRG
jgi:septation ring formation regulator EzrA